MNVTIDDRLGITNANGSDKFLMNEKDRSLTSSFCRSFVSRSINGLIQAYL